VHQLWVLSGPATTVFYWIGWREASVFMLASKISAERVPFAEDDAEIWKRVQWTFQPPELEFVRGKAHDFAAKVCNSNPASQLIMPASAEMLHDDC
jgi:hypothetical protein